MKIVSFYKVDYALTRAAVAFFRAALDSNAETEARKLAGTVYLD